MARRRVDKFSSLDSVISRVPIEIVLTNEKRRIWKKAFFEDELFEERKNQETEREREKWIRNNFRNQVEVDFKSFYKSF